MAQVERIPAEHGQAKRGQVEQAQLERQTAPDFGDIAVDRTRDVPIGVQIAWALRARIAGGRLTAGQRLPGVRELAELVGVNANTARAVYQRLEREGLIESRHGTGTFVAGSAKAHEAAEARSDAGRLAADVARDARELGVDPREVAAALYVTSDAPAPAADGVERRRRLRAQIAALEQSLAEIEAGNPGILPAPSDAPRMAGPRLLGVEELEDVRMRLVRRLSDAQLALDARATDSATAAGQAAATRDDAKQRRQVQGGKRSSAKASKRGAGPRPATRPSTA